jgi:capsular polysaccharide biosynthesis protein
MAYFHWLTEALPRLIAAAPFLDGHTLLLPEKYEREPFIKASLELLNCKVHFFKWSRKQKVKELVVPGHTAGSGHYSIPLIKEVRQRFLDATAKTPQRKIYISRQKAPRRKIMNEDAVVALVQQYGYEIHFFEDYTLQQQIAIMAGTRYLIGLHGAGLTNMLFMPAPGKILELRNRQDDHNNCFFTLASALDHDYYYLNNAGDTTDTHRVNITVDTAQLQQVLHRMEHA